MFSLQKKREGKRDLESPFLRTVRGAPDGNGFLLLDNEEEQFARDFPF